MNSDSKDKQNHRKSRLMGFGVSIGVGLGAALGIIFDHLAAGVGTGVALEGQKTNADEG